MECTEGMQWGWGADKKQINALLLSEMTEAQSTDATAP